MAREANAATKIHREQTRGGTAFATNCAGEETGARARQAEGVERAATELNHDRSECIQALLKRGYKCKDYTDYRVMN